MDVLMQEPIEMTPKGKCWKVHYMLINYQGMLICLKKFIGSQACAMDHRSEQQRNQKIPKNLQLHMLLKG